MLLLLFTKKRTGIFVGAIVQKNDPDSFAAWREHVAAPHSILGSPLTVCGLVEEVPQVLCLDLANVEGLVPIIHAIVMIVPNA